MEDESKKRKREKEEERAEFLANQRYGTSLAHTLGLLRQPEDNQITNSETKSQNTTGSSEGSEAKKRRVFGVWLSNEDVPDIKGVYKVASVKEKESESTDDNKPPAFNYGPEFVKPRIGTETNAVAEDEASEKQQEKKQHNGLRCKKCWALLCRDDDFDYRNGRLWVNPEVLRPSSGWEGLVIQKGKVYCQNMHCVGAQEATTWTNQTRWVSFLRVDKTTFIENFVQNPKWANSDKIKNKLKTTEGFGKDRKQQKPTESNLPT